MLTGLKYGIMLCVTSVNMLNFELVIDWAEDAFVRGERNPRVFIVKDQLSLTIYVK